MTRKLFGTDGVRGRANSWPMTAELALKLGAAAGRHFRRDGSSAHRVVIGKDTRLSGYMLENALTAGFTSTGMTSARPTSKSPEMLPSAARVSAMKPACDWYG